MPDKPTTATGYSPQQVARVRATCLYMATKLGDLMPELVVVGGLVPALLIDQQNLPENVTAYVGTMDLDLGLALALVNEDRYQEMVKRLRSAGFEPDRNDEGKPTRQRWRISNPPVTVDFLIEPQNGGKKPGSIFSLTADWGAIVAPGLHLAFQNNRTITLTGQTIAGEIVVGGREVRVCGAGAFVVLKALAFHIRGENKDAYDLFYLLGNYGTSVADVAAELLPLLADPCVQDAMKYLRDDFADVNSLGPRRASEFLFGRADEPTQADVVGFMRDLLNACASQLPWFRG